MKGPLDVTQKTLCVPFMVVKFAFGLASTHSIEFFSFDPAYMFCSLQLMVYSASIRKPSYCMNVSCLFCGEKNSKEDSSAHGHLETGKLFKRQEQ